MRQAQELLRTTTLTMSEIAEKIGYARASHFASVFRQTYGCTPSAYRKRQT